MNIPNTPEKFNISFERCVNNPLFIDQFYDIFLNSSDEIKPMFNDTNMETQKAMLATSMAYMTSSYKSDPTLLADIAIKHNKNNLNIKPHLYAYWLDSLITAAKTTDSAFNLQTEQMWRDIMQPGINQMIESYNNTTKT